MKGRGFSRGPAITTRMSAYVPNTSTLGERSNLCALGGLQDHEIPCDDNMSLEMLRGGFAPGLVRDSIYAGGEVRED